MNEKEQLEYERLKRDAENEGRYNMAVEQIRKEVRNNSGEAKFKRWKKKRGL